MTRRCRRARRACGRSTLSARCCCAPANSRRSRRPGAAWHDHGHDGKGPVIWLDALDLPLFIDLEAAYSVERELQAPKNRPDASEVEYATPGMVPARRNGNARPSYPMM